MGKPLKRTLVLARNCMPARSPWAVTWLTLLTLRTFDAPAWAWEADTVALAVVWFLWASLRVTEKPMDIFETWRKEQ